LERKVALFLKNGDFQWVLRMPPLWPIGSLPGQKSIRLAKKVGIPLCPRRTSAVISPAIPFPPRLFAERRVDGNRKVAPGPFCLRRLLFCPGNEKTGFNDPLNWRRIKIYYRRELQGGNRIQSDPPATAGRGPGYGSTALEMILSSKFPAEKRGAFGFYLISSFGMIKFL